MLCINPYARIVFLHPPILYFIDMNLHIKGVWGLRPCRVQRPLNSPLFNSTSHKMGIRQEGLVNWACICQVKICIQFIVLVLKSIEMYQHLSEQPIVVYSN